MGPKLKNINSVNQENHFTHFFQFFLIKMGSKPNSSNFVLQEHQLYTGFHWTKILKTKGRSHTWYCSVEGFLAKNTFWYSWNFIEGSFQVENNILVLVKFLWWQFGVQNGFSIFVKFHRRQFSGWKWHFGFCEIPLEGVQVVNWRNASLPIANAILGYRILMTFLFFSHPHPHHDHHHHGHHDHHNHISSCGTYKRWTASLPRTTAPSSSQFQSTSFLSWWEIHHRDHNR